MKKYCPIVLALGMLGLWQLVVSITAVPDYLLPTPWQVIQALFYQHHLLIVQTLPTVVETLLGLMGAIIFGMIFALAMAYVYFLRAWLKPLLLISQALPTFAIAPLMVLWFGYGIFSKIIIIWLMLFFPVSSAFFDGLQRTPSVLLDYAHVINASRGRILRYVRVPAAKPALATGIRVATAGAPLGAVIGEWVGSSQGLGFLMINANARLQIDVMFSALFILVVWNLLLYKLVDKVLKRWVD